VALTALLGVVHSKVGIVDQCGGVTHGLVKGGDTDGAPDGYRRRRCVVETADVLNPRPVGGQIAWASSVNAAAIRRTGASTASS
jgi:hypothetical protein